MTMILASRSRSMFLRSINLMVQFFLTYDLDLSRSSPLQNHILDHISGTIRAKPDQILAQGSLGKGI